MPCFGVDVMKIMPNNFQHFDHEILQAEIFFILDQIWVSGMCVCERERERVCVCTVRRGIETLRLYLNKNKNKVLKPSRNVYNSTGHIHLSIIKLASLYWLYRYILRWAA